MFVGGSSLKEIEQSVRHKLQQLIESPYTLKYQYKRMEVVYWGAVLRVTQDLIKE